LHAAAHAQDHRIELAVADHVLSEVLSCSIRRS
jgi:hypothetical protein